MVAIDVGPMLVLRRRLPAMRMGTQRCCIIECMRPLAFPSILEFFQTETNLCRKVWFGVVLPVHCPHLGGASRADRTRSKFSRTRKANDDERQLLRAACGETESEAECFNHGGPGNWGRACPSTRQAKRDKLYMRREGLDDVLDSEGTP